MSDPSPKRSAKKATVRPAHSVEDSVRNALARERRRLADLLHRTASQSLTAAYYSALVLARKSPDAASHAADLAALPDLIHTAIEELREITREFLDPVTGQPPPV